jgi:toxin ParE1/3/4
VSRVVLAAQVRADFDRIFDFLFESAPEFAAVRIEAIIAAIDILQTSPLIGRPVAFGQRELVIATGSSGYLALYRYDPVRDTAFVFAVRSQRERGSVVLQACARFHHQDLLRIKISSSSAHSRHSRLL